MQIIAWLAKEIHGCINSRTHRTAFQPFSGFGVPSSYGHAKNMRRRSQRLRHLNHTHKTLKTYLVSQPTSSNPLITSISIVPGFISPGASTKYSGGSTVTRAHVCYPSPRTRSAGRQPRETFCSSAQRTLTPSFQTPYFLTCRVSTCLLPKIRATIATVSMLKPPSVNGRAPSGLRGHESPSRA
jgi:hypothetical protein